LKEGHAETIVRELFICGRNTRRQQYCSITQMMIQLLDLISKDREMYECLSLCPEIYTFSSPVSDVFEFIIGLCL